MKFKVKPIKDAEISLDNVWDVYDTIKTILGEDELLLSLAKAMGDEKLADLLDYIAKAHDLELEEDGEFENFNIEDDLQAPNKLENFIAGQGKLGATHEKYKDFVIWKTDEGKYDIYDKFLQIWGAAYSTVDAAKADIDKAYNDPQLKKQIGKKASRVAKRRITLPGGYSVNKYVDDDDEYWEILKGGAANVNENEVIGQYNTIKEVIEELISERILNKDDFDPPIERYKREITQRKEYIDDIKGDIYNLEHYIEKHMPVAEKAKAEKNYELFGNISDKITKATGRIERLKLQINRLKQEIADFEKKLNPKNVSEINSGIKKLKLELEAEGGLIN